MEPIPVPMKSKVSEKILQQKQNLPIYCMKNELLKVVQKNQIVIVRGETGSGKSTQLTQYLYEWGFATCGKIGCTQPRRVAATSLAERVAEEMGVILGDQVGYKIRFDYKAAMDTSIIYMTDGILLRELAMEPHIYSYSAIILDEAHERQQHTDMLLGLLKLISKKRPDLKIIITSATIDCTQFSKYFDNTVVFEIPGRTFPVEIRYEGTSPLIDRVTPSLSLIRRIVAHESPGDILVFLPGQHEIEQLCEQLALVDSRQEFHILPFYSSLKMEEQNKVFEPIPPGKTRKVVVATNIAETSVTIDGIVFVIDSGIMKESKFDPTNRLLTLNTKPITKAQAIQRSGRAGRTQPGVAYRLYSETVFLKMADTPTPEIQRGNLETNILLLAAHGVEDIYKFDFMDPPSPATIKASLTELEDLEALDSSGRLTALGRQIVRFPLEPRLAKILIKSVELHCAEDILTLVSLLSSQTYNGKVFIQPRKMGRQGNIYRAKFFKPEGDYATLLHAFQAWEENHRSESWCERNFLNFKALQESDNIKSQLRAIMESNGLRPLDNPQLRESNAVGKAIVSGYFSQVARKASSGYEYVTYSSLSQFAYIHPSSSLFKRAPTWLIYEEFMKTSSKPSLINTMTIEPDWINRFAPKFYRKMGRLLNYQVRSRRSYDFDLDYMDYY